MRSCNLELQLLPPCCDEKLYGQDHTITSPHDHHYPMMDMNMNGGISTKEEQQKRQQQQLTIFYNGKMAVCDVTDLQARAIIEIAKRESGKRPNSPSSPIQCSLPIQQSQQQHNSNGTIGLSMKKSCQRFLQNRKNRVRSASPY